MILYADEILTRLQADETFMGLLGRYHFSDGTDAESMAVLASHEQVPGVDHIEGLECVIARAPDAAPMKTKLLDYDGGTCLYAEKTWRIYLIQYEGATSGNTVVQAADRLLQLCPNAGYSHLGSGFSELAGVEQIQVKLPPNVLIQHLHNPSVYVAWDGGNWMTGEDALQPWETYDGGEFVGG